jgi:hypothetical protein
MKETYRKQEEGRKKISYNVEWGGGGGNKMEHTSAM